MKVESYMLNLSNEYGRCGLGKGQSQLGERVKVNFRNGSVESVGVVKEDGVGGVC